MTKKALIFLQWVWLGADHPTLGVAFEQFYNLGHTHLYDKESVALPAVGVA